MHLLLEIKSLNVKVGSDQALKGFGYRPKNWVDLSPTHQSRHPEQFGP